MKKFVDIEKAKKLKDFDSNKQLITIKQLIKNLSFIRSYTGLGPIWLVGVVMDQKLLPRCSILEINYDEKQECFLTDLIFCHPQIWKLTKSERDKTKLNHNKRNAMKNKIIRIIDKFTFHVANIAIDPRNSLLNQIEADFKAILFYLKDLKKSLIKSIQN